MINFACNYWRVFCVSQSWASARGRGVRTRVGAPLSWKKMMPYGGLFVTFLSLWEAFFSMCGLLLVFMGAFFYPCRGIFATFFSLWENFIYVGTLFGLSVGPFMGSPTPHENFYGHPWSQSLCCIVSICVSRYSKTIHK